VETGLMYWRATHQGAALRLCISFTKHQGTNLHGIV